MDRLHQVQAIPEDVFVTNRVARPEPELISQQSTHKQFWRGWEPLFQISKHDLRYLLFNRNFNQEYVSCFVKLAMVNQFRMAAWRQEFATEVTVLEN